MKKLTLQDIIFLALCISIGFVSKRAVTPFTNLATEFFRIPGGSLAAGLPLMFLTLGAYKVKKFGAATLMGLVQGAMALMLGMTGMQGAFALLTFTFPGLVIDLVGLKQFSKQTTFFLAACTLGTVGSAIFSNIIVFRMTGSVLMMWVIVGTFSGLVCGYLGSVIYKRTERLFKFNG